MDVPRARITTLTKLINKSLFGNQSQKNLHPSINYGNIPSRKNLKSGLCNAAGNLAGFLAFISVHPSAFDPLCKLNIEKIHIYASPMKIIRNNTELVNEMFVAIELMA